MINLRTVMSGPNGTFQPGVHSMGAEAERQLVDGGYATYVKAPERGETAVLQAPETAAMPPVRSRLGLQRRGR